MISKVSFLFYNYYKTARIEEDVPYDLSPIAALHGTWEDFRQDDSPLCSESLAGKVLTSDRKQGGRHDEQDMCTYFLVLHSSYKSNGMAKKISCPQNEGGTPQTWSRTKAYTVLR